MRSPMKTKTKVATCVTASFLLLEGGLSLAAALTTACTFTLGTISVAIPPIALIVGGCALLLIAACFLLKVACSAKEEVKQMEEDKPKEEVKPKQETPRYKNYRPTPLNIKLEIDKDLIMAASDNEHRVNQEWGLLEPYQPSAASLALPRVTGAYDHPFFANVPAGVPYQAACGGWFIRLFHKSDPVPFN